MTTATPSAPANRLGFTKQDYVGSKSTLCAGCGHDAITAQIINAAFESNIEGHRVTKYSGIGCSSKTPAYFINQGWGFNSVHGRMPSIATGASLANRQLINIGVSGDGDSMSIGMGQFVHAVRRNIPMIYIIEDNGVYGLTKGQFSATADKGSKSKRGIENSDSPVDLVALALQLGATYVARSFSGDKAQLVPLIKGALLHRGAAFIDVVSPCVTFNNHAGSTKSYDYVREHNEVLNRLDVLMPKKEITAMYAPGCVHDVVQHDGSILRLRKLAEDYEPGDRVGAMNHLQAHAARGEVVTGLIYVDPVGEELHEHLHTVATPLNSLGARELSPGSAALAALNASLR
jgi:2-oxoglutarate ferredoxin oxidoreductase subunit beta